jgi:DNA repair protein SbcD/Mre11
MRSSVPLLRHPHYRRAMRFLHTADWHLGRLMYGVRLTDDQAHVLQQLELLAKESRPDVILVSGDIYDRAVPPPDAVALLDEFLSRVVLDLGIPVIMIAGNHDSPHRLEFASRVLAGRGLYVCGSVRTDPMRMTLHDDAGPVHFCAVPYAEPALVRETLMTEDAQDHEAALRLLIDRIRLGIPERERSVLVSHAFAQGGIEAESERPLSLGGADKVDASLFAAFQYTALGHLHRPQSAGASHIRYAGSLLKYSFSEVDHHKGVLVVDMDDQGSCQVEHVALTPRRDVRRLEGHLKELLTGPRNGENQEDYLLVSLLDTGAILDVMGKLREVYPNVLHVERAGMDAGAQRPQVSRDHRKLNDSDLFADFFAEVTGEPPTGEEASAYESVVDELRRRDREAAAT